MSATALGATLAAGPASAAPDDYVALGDSFSAGTGTRASTDDCYRSPYGYPALIAAREGLTLDYQACSGATTSDVLSNQLGTLDAATGYVTMTIGGNDVGFADVLTECALPGWISDCHGEIDESLVVLRTQLPGRLDTVYGQIDDRAPNADVAIAGYPYLFNGRDCSWATFFSGSEMRRLNDGTAELDRLIQDRSQRVGFDYVEVRDDFAGHAVCDSPAWINNLTLPIVESFHPNRAGNEAYAAAITPSLAEVATQQGRSAPRAGGQQSAAAPQSTSDAGGPSLREQADVVLAMDLTSEANLRRAGAEGVDRGRITRAVAWLRSGNDAVVRRGLAELQRLDAEHAAATKD